MPTGCFHPYWKPRIKGICHPFEIPAVLKPVYTNRKNGVCIYTSQNAKILTVDPPIRRGKTVGIFNAAFIGTGNIHASRTASAVHFFGTLPRVLEKNQRTLYVQLYKLVKRKIDMEQSSRSICGLPSDLYLGAISRKHYNYFTSSWFRTLHPFGRIRV